MVERAIPGIFDTVISLAVLDNAWNERYQRAQTIIVHGYYPYAQLRNTGCYPGSNPFNQNFLAEIRNFLGVEWIATGPNGPFPFHLRNEFRAHLHGK